MIKKVKRLRIALIVISVYAGLMTYAMFINNPLPILPDNGHRFFGVRDQQTAVVLANIFKKQAGVGERMTFRPTPTNQMLLTDNMTVLGWMDKKNDSVSTNGISFPVHDPKKCAEETRDTLIAHGYKAKVIYGLIPKVADKLYTVTSDAFDNGIIVYRRHMLMMGSAPGQTKLTK